MKIYPRVEERYLMNAIYRNCYQHGGFREVLGDNPSAAEMAKKGRELNQIKEFRMMVQEQGLDEAIDVFGERERGLF